MSTSTSKSPSVDEAPILHVDLDAFFASVEVLDDPALAGRPVAVGGAGERGVIASASYEARRYGVHSAMPSVVAKRRCPGLLILPGRFDRYEEYSRRFVEIARDLTPDVERLGLDELFADLRSLRRLHVRPLEAAAALRARIEEELSLRCGVGLARNKLFAKLASKAAKPRVVDGRLVDGPGVVWVDPVLESEWLVTLPVRALWGVGPATAAKLGRLGIQWVRDLRSVDEATLTHHFGPALARTLAGYARGDDDRPVEVARVAKSLGHDQTFAVSLRGAEEVERALATHGSVVARALRDKGLVARTVTLVVRFDDWSTVSRAQTLPFGLDDEAAITAVAVALADAVDLSRAVRLLGVHASGFVARDANEVQLAFDVGGADGSGREAVVAASQERQVSGEALRDAIDEIRRRFGRTSVATAAELTGDGVLVATQRGRAAFGPDPRRND